MARRPANPDKSAHRARHGAKRASDGQGEVEREGIRGRDLPGPQDEVPRRRKESTPTRLGRGGESSVVAVGPPSPPSSSSSRARGEPQTIEGPRIQNKWDGESNLPARLDRKARYLHAVRASPRAGHRAFGAGVGVFRTGTTGELDGQSFPQELGTVCGCRIGRVSRPERLSTEPSADSDEVTHERLGAPRPNVSIRHPRWRRVRGRQRTNLERRPWHRPHPRTR